MAQRAKVQELCSQPQGGGRPCHALSQVQPLPHHPVMFWFKGAKHQGGMVPS